jgi:Caspase domain
MVLKAQLLDSIDFATLTRAVIVGVDAAAAAGVPTLSCAQREATQFAAALADPDTNAVPSDQITLLLGRQASRAVFIEKFREAVAHLSESHALIFYFAGHSIAMDGVSYLCTHDADLADLPATAISSTLLDEMLRASNARGVLIILDCCNSAGFGEDLRATLLGSSKGQYRALIAASRKGEASWELPDGQGTLFSRTLLEILQGKIAVGKPPGRIFFSDLQRELGNRLQERRELAAPGIPAQQLFTFQAAAHDPLLFHNRRLTLKQIALSTERYSPGFVRRRTLQVAGAIVTLAVTVIAGWYGILLNSQYIAIGQSSRLAINEGLPKLQLPGFPRLLWQTALPPSALNVPGARSTSFTYVARLGAPALAELSALLRADYRAELLLGYGQEDEARRYAHQALAEAPARSEAATRAMLVIANVADPRDYALLRTWLVAAPDVPGDVMLAAFHSVGRTSPDIIASPEYAALRSRREFSVNEASFINTIRDTCTPALQRALDHTLDSRAYYVAGSDAEIGLISWMAGCEIADSRIVAAFSKAMTTGQVTALVRYFSQQGRSDVADAQLRAHLRRLPADSPDEVDFIRGVGELTASGCPEEFANLLKQRPLAVQVHVAQAMARRCEGAQATAHWVGDNTTGVLTLSLLRNTQTTWSTTINVGPAIAYEGGSPLMAAGQPLVDFIASSAGEKAADALEALIKVPFFREWRDAMRALRTLDPARRSNLRVEEFQYPELFLWEAAMDRQGMFARMMTALLNREQFFQELLPGRIAQTENELAALSAALGREPEIAVRAACPLAMSGTVADLAKLLVHPAYEIRFSAARCMPYNANVSAALDFHAREEQVFRNEFIREIRENLRVRQVLERRLAALTPDDQRLMLYLLLHVPYLPLHRSVVVWIEQQWDELENVSRAPRKI